MSADEALISSLPGDMKRIAEVAGLEAAIRIGQAFRGTFLYVSGVDDMARSVRDEMIRREYYPAVTETFSPVASLRRAEAFRM